MSIFDDISAFCKDHSGVIAIASGIATAVGIGAIVLCAPVGILLLAGAAGCGVGIAVCSSSGTHWYFRSTEIVPEPVDPDVLTDTQKIFNVVEKMSAEIDSMKVHNDVVLKNTEKLKADVARTEEKIDTNAGLESTMLTSIVEGQAEITGVLREKLEAVNHSRRNQINVAENRYTSFHYTRAIESTLDPTQDELQRLLTS